MQYLHQKGNLDDKVEMIKLPLAKFAHEVISEYVINVISFIKNPAVNTLNRKKEGRCLQRVAFTLMCLPPIHSPRETEVDRQVFVSGLLRRAPSCKIYIHHR